jgi:ABC-type taurine transport system substrate-binding protein
VKNIFLKDMTKTEIAKAFSNGEFEKTNNFISDNAEWIVIEEDRFIGKQAILDNCEQVGNYFKSVTTNFKTLNIITDGNKVVINGTAEFLRDNKRISFVSDCDVYEFNEKSEIQKITSYCIQH